MTQSPPPTSTSRYREPVVAAPVWPGRRWGLDLINILTLGTVLIPTGVVLLVVLYGWNLWIGPCELVLFAGGSLLTCYGITLGYHRYFTHGSFQTTWWMKRTLGILASLNVQGPILFWCSCHRLHHQYSDRDGDLHSPHLSGTGFWGRLKGIIHAHFGWIVFAGSYRYNAKVVRDLYEDEDIRFVDHYYLLWIFLGLAVPAAIGGAWHHSWQGAALGFFWGGLARVFFIHHLTWSVNSFGHIFGDQPFETHDESRNNWFLGVVGLGDGWHNNHHAFPQSARHGLAWWQLDSTFLVIRLLEKCGLAWNVRDVSPEQITRKQRLSAAA